MLATRRLLTTLILTALLAAARPAPAAPPEPQGDPQFWSNYNAGLLAMRDGRFADAVPLLTAAIKRKPDPRVYLARVAAYTLQEKFDDAIDDLSHANIPAEQGKRPTREPQLWRTIIWAMSNKAPDGTEANGIGGQVFFSGIPGNMVQGGDDYPTDYASLLAYEMATPYRDAHFGNGSVNPNIRPAPPANFAPIFKRAGQWFANRNLATPSMAAFNLKSAEALLEKNNLPAALDAANLAKVVYPFDSDIRFVVAEAYRRLGRPETARREYTIVLTMATDHAAAYRGRALAAAAEGDSRRALDDLRSAAKLDPKGNAAIEDQVGTLLAQHPLIATPGALLAKLDAAAAAGKSFEDLESLALDLHRASAASRMRYDELYQDNVHHLEDATRQSPKNPDAWVAFATYLLDELHNRGDAVEPRQATQFYRYQYSEDMEVNRAMFALNKALAINPKHPGALVRMAFAYDALNETIKAENCINQVLELVGTKNADAIRLLAEYRASQAGSMRGQARSLRTPRTTSNSHTENRSDGVYTVTNTTTTYPSQAELAQADELDAQARALVAQAKDLMESALKQNPNSLDGALLQAEYDEWFGTDEQALAALKGAVKKYPASLKAHDALTDFLLARGMTDDATDARMIASKLFETTSAPLLQKIWANIQENGWPRLMEILQPARDADPADARATVYLAQAQADAKETDAAAATARVAMALELARLQLDDQGDGKTLPRPAADFALTLRLLGGQSVREAKANQFDQAMIHGKMAIALIDRFEPGGKGQLMFGAMFPDPKAPKIPVPAPVNGATLAAQIYTSIGEIAQSQNHLPEARGYFLAVAQLAQPRGKGIPQVSNARGDSNFSDKATGPAVALAMIELAKIDLAQNNANAALDALNVAGSAQPDAQQRQEINNLMLTAARQVNNAQMQIQQQQNQQQQQQAQQQYQQQMQQQQQQLQQQLQQRLAPRPAR